jgi:hypothetical protein
MSPRDIRRPLTANLRQRENTGDFAKGARGWPVEATGTVRRPDQNACPTAGDALANGGQNGFGPPSRGRFFGQRSGQRRTSRSGHYRSRNTSRCKSRCIRASATSRTCTVSWAPRALSRKPITWPWTPNSIFLHRRRNRDLCRPGDWRCCVRGRQHADPLFPASPAMGAFLPTTLLQLRPPRGILQ